MDETRQSPEQFLREIEEEEHTQKRGHLKIFFGYAAGVGKTYAMLKAAHAAQHRGVDVTAGYIEPHARPQTGGLFPAAVVFFVFVHGLPFLVAVRLRAADAGRPESTRHGSMFLRFFLFCSKNIQL